MLFQRFDRLLLLAKGRRTVYFGEIGKNSKTLVDYFVRNGGPACPSDTNPAEYMLHVIGAAPGTHTDIDRPAVWRQSPEYHGVQDKLARLCAGAQSGGTALHDGTSYTEFAAGFGVQLWEVTKRVFQQYWRSPSYIFSKAILSFDAVCICGLKEDVVHLLTPDPRHFSSDCPS